MNIEIKYALFNTTQDTWVSEGEKYHLVQISNDVNLEGREGLKVMSDAIAKDINRSTADIKILGYKIL